MTAENRVEIAELLATIPPHVRRVEAVAKRVSGPAKAVLDKYAAAATAPSAPQTRRSSKMGSNIATASPLTGGEERRLVHCEKTVEKGMGTFREVGQALLEIRDSRLYRREYETFADYCKKRWGFTHGRARQLISAAKIQSDTTVSLSGERSTRELARVPTDQRETVLAWAEEKSGDQPLTAAAIKSAAKDVLESESDEEEEEEEEEEEDESVAEVVHLHEPEEEDVEPVDHGGDCKAEEDNAVAYIREALTGGGWISSSKLFRALSAPEMKVRSWLNESSVPEELENRHEMYKFTNITLDEALLRGMNIINITLNAMVWLDIVEMRLTASGVPEYRLAKEAR